MQLIKPKGYLFISTVEKTKGSFLWNTIMNEFVFGFYPIGTHKWNNLVEKSTLIDLMEENGFVVVA